MAAVSDLTGKQEKFAQSVAGGKTLSDAYRDAYNAGSMKAESVQVKASELASSGKVSVRIEQLKEELAAKELWTRENSVKALKDLITPETPPSAIVAAVKELNAMHGYNAPAKHELTGKDGAPLIPRPKNRAEIEAELIAAGFDPAKIALEE